MPKFGYIIRVPAGKPYAFIRGEDKNDYFVHRNDCPNFDDLYNDFVRSQQEGLKINVSFDGIKTDKGWRAEKVIILSASL